MGFGAIVGVTKQKITSLYTRKDSRLRINAQHTTKVVKNPSF